MASKIHTISARPAERLGVLPGSKRHWPGHFTGQASPLSLESGYSTSRARLPSICRRVFTTQRWD